MHIEGYGLGKAVTLNFVDVMENTSYGMYLQSKGNLTLNTIRAWLNDDDGANITSGGYPLVVKFSSFMANGHDGLFYDDSDPVGLPLFTFTNTSNVFLGNTHVNLDHGH